MPHEAATVTVVLQSNPGGSLQRTVQRATVAKVTRT